jgi:coenzyme Q-binding protein COQ10
MPKHAENKLFPHSPSQMFDLVADVGKYPQFLPWCVGARVRSRTEHEQVADLTIGFGPFRESFTSRVTMERPPDGGAGLIKVRYENGPFRYLNNQWKFLPHAQGTQIEFWVDFEFRSRVLQAAIGVVFNEAVRRMVNAFLKRAQDVYGPATATVSVAPAPSGS